MEYWQKDIETMNRKDLEKLQLERLKKTIEAAGNSPFYKKVLAENGITDALVLYGVQNFVKDTNLRF